MQTIKHALKQLFDAIPALERTLHALVIVWVALQIISSSYMHIHHLQDWQNANLISQVHVYGGLMLGVISVLFTIKTIARRGFADLFPWLKGDFSVIIVDLKTLMTFRLPIAKPRGLAAAIEGLGLSALLIAVATGAMWFISVQSHTEISGLLGLHKSSVGLIETYFYGHGLFAILHLLQIIRCSPHGIKQ